MQKSIKIKPTTFLKLIINFKTLLGEDAGASVVLRKRRPEKGGSRDEDCVVHAREKNCVLEVEDVCDQSGRRPNGRKPNVGED